MKKFIMGLFTGLTITTTAVFGSNLIKSAEYNTSKIVFDGVELDTAGQPMVSIQEEGVSGTKNYMPVRSVLEQMGYNVTWDGTNNTVIIKSGSTGNSIINNTTVVTNDVQSDKDIRHNIDDNIIFTDGTEVRVLDTYTTHEVQTTESGSYTSSTGHLYYAIELEITAGSNPYSGRYWSPIYFIKHVKTVDGTIYDQPSFFGDDFEIYPNEKTVKTVHISILENEDISEVQISNGIGETAIVNVK